MIIILDIFLGTFRGITLFPFIILKEKKLKNNKTLVNHERIHLRQQLEMIVIPFYIWYLIEYTIERIKFGKIAYFKSSFEMEAYDNDDNLEYLKTRKPYAWIKYL